MLQQEHFEQCLQQTFHIEPGTGDAPVPAELIEVSSLPQHGEAERRPFSIVLQHAGDQILPQRIYRIDHPQLGTLDLFLVPIGQDSNGVRYEAVFN